MIREVWSMRREREERGRLGKRGKGGKGRGRGGGRGVLFGGGELEVEHGEVGTGRGNERQEHSTGHF